MQKFFLALSVFAITARAAKSSTAPTTDLDLDESQVFWSLPIPSSWPEKAIHSVSCKEFAEELLDAREYQGLRSKLNQSRQIASVTTLPVIDISDAKARVHLKSKSEGDQVRTPANVDDTTWTLSLDEDGSFDNSHDAFLHRQTNYVFKIHAAEGAPVVCGLDHVRVEVDHPVDDHAKVVSQSFAASDCEKKVLDYHEVHERFWSAESSETVHLEDLHDDFGFAELCRESIPYFAALK